MTDGSTELHKFAKSFQSPSRGGHLCDLPIYFSAASGFTCFSPLREGDTSVTRKAERNTPHTLKVFQSPSRGGHLCDDAGERRAGYHRAFQSPSRGGHLCDPAAATVDVGPFFGFSPLREGDTSVTRNMWCSRLLQ